MIKTAIAHLKGGVGKSTTTLFVAEHWALKGLRVLVVDLDPQASVSHMLLSRRGLLRWETSHKTLPHFLADIRDGVQQPALSYIVMRASDMLELRDKSSPGYVSIIPSIPRLWFDGYDIDRFFFSNNQDPTVAIANVLENFFNEIVSHFDCVFLDCPPGFGTFTRAALRLADKIVSPTIADNTSVRSLVDFVNLGLIRSLNIDPRQRLLVVVSKFTGTNNQKTVLEYLRQSFHVISPPIPMRDHVLNATECLDGRTRKYAQKYQRPLHRPLATDVKKMSNALYSAIIES